MTNYFYIDKRFETLYQENLMQNSIINKIVDQKARWQSLEVDRIVFSVMPKWSVVFTRFHWWNTFMLKIGAKVIGLRFEIRMSGEGSSTYIFTKKGFIGSVDHWKV